MAGIDDKTPDIIGTVRRKRRPTKYTEQKGTEICRHKPRSTNCLV